MDEHAKLLGPTLRALGFGFVLMAIPGTIIFAMFALVYFGGTWGGIALFAIIAIVLVLCAYGFARSMESLKQQ